MVCFSFISIGASVGYPTQALPQLRNETNAALNLNEYEGSFLASIFWISGIVSCPIGGSLSGWLGRRKVLMILTPIGACGWLLIGLAQNKLMIYFGMFINASALTALARLFSLQSEYDTRGNSNN